MIVDVAALRKDQTVTIKRGDQYVGSGKILELDRKYILLVEQQRGGRLTQHIPLDGREQYTLLC